MSAIRTGLGVFLGILCWLTVAVQVDWRDTTRLQAAADAAALAAIHELPASPEDMARRFARANLPDQPVGIAVRVGTWDHRTRIFAETARGAHAVRVELSSDLSLGSRILGATGIRPPPASAVAIAAKPAPTDRAPGWPRSAALVE